MRSSLASENPGWGLVLGGGLVVLVICCFAYYPTRAGSIANSLRGGGVLIVDLPRQGKNVERIDVSDKKFATRTFYPIQHPRAYSKIMLTEDLWEAIEKLRHDWCAKPPTFQQTDVTRPFYEVAVQCGRAANPVFRIPSDQLPQPLVTLVTVVPPPPEVWNGRLVDHP